MDPCRHRRLLLVLGATFVAVVVLVIVAFPSGDPAALPAPLEAVSPVPGEAVVGQVPITIDLPVGYEIALVVDGLPIPTAEIYTVPSLGTFRWQPGAGGAIEQWGPGDHTIEVTWDRMVGQQPDPGLFSWTFRVT